MALTSKNLVSEEPHLGGVQRIYKFKNGWGLSLVNSSRIHAYTFAWEAAVLNPDGELSYDTAITLDIEVFHSDEETNAFIKKARNYFEMSDEECKIQEALGSSLEPNISKLIKKEK
jgi:hypothetical protein